MKLKLWIMSLLALPLLLCAGVDFEWRYSLNNRYHDDPYGYRYALAERFRVRESGVIYMLDSVREPSDAYMIFRLAELSGKSYEHILRIYRQNGSWRDIALLSGIDPHSHGYEALRHTHDLRDDYRSDRRRYERYEDKGVVIRREEIYIPQTYQEQQKRYPDHRKYRDEGYDERYRGH